MRPRPLFVMLLLALVLSCPSHLLAQKIGEGLWNSGRSFAPRPGTDSLKVQKLLARVQLYPGFAVVRTDMELLNPGPDNLRSSLRFRDSATTTQVFFGSLSNLPPATRLVLRGKDTLAAGVEMVFSPGLSTVSVLEITPNHQAILSKDGSVREGNAFVYTLYPEYLSLSRVLVELKTGLTLTNVMGVHPSTAMSTMSQVAYTPTEQDLVIWYNGAPPDMKMEKKVMPLKQQLFAEMDSFNLSMFGSPEFRPVQQQDFSTNKRSPFISFLYFLMFSAPWILMIGFLVWLAFKPKKKKQQ